MRVRGVGLLLAVSMLALAAGSPHSAAQLGVTESGVVRGRVEIGIPVTVRRPSTVYPSRAVGQPVLAPASELRHVVVFIKDAPATRTEPTNVEIRQRDETFLPRVVAVPVGSTVDFPNDDPIYHNVFSLSRAKGFNLGRYPRGDTRVVHFTAGRRQGVLRRPFAHVGDHLVFNHPWFAVVAGRPLRTQRRSRWATVRSPRGTSALAIPPCVRVDAGRRHRRRVRPSRPAQ